MEPGSFPQNSYLRLSAMPCAFTQVTYRTTSQNTIHTNYNINCSLRNCAVQNLHSCTSGPSHSSIYIH